MYHDPRSPKRQFETSLAYQGNNDTVRERREEERERQRERDEIFDIERERGQGRFETRISFAVCYEREIHARERSHHCLQGKIRETSGIVVFVGRISRKDRSSSGVHMACRENSSGKRCKTTREERAGRKRSANKKRRTVYSESKYIYLFVILIQRGRCCRNKNDNIFNNLRKTFDYFGNLINMIYRNI